MQHLGVSGAVRPLKWSLGVKWLIMNLVKGSANSSDTIAQVGNFISCSFFFCYCQHILLHMMYRQIHKKNYAYIHTFFILCTEFLACMQAAVCTHDTKGSADRCQYSAHLLYCAVQVLPRYPRIRTNLKRFDILTMPLLSICCATRVYCKGLIQPPSPLPQ